MEHAEDLKPDRQGQEDEGKETSYNISGFDTMVDDVDSSYIIADSQ